MTHVETSSAPPQSRRKLPSPGCLFALLALLGLASACGWFAWRVHQRAAAIRHFEQFGIANSLRIELEPASPIWLHDLVWAIMGKQYTTGFQDVVALVLDHTQIADDDVQHVTGFRNLRVLSLSNTRITDSALQHLRCLTDLSELYLIDTHISDPGLWHLSGLTNLQTLYLDDTQITDAGLQHLSGLTDLQYLHLSGTGITDAGLRHLSGLRTLQYLHIGNTQVTDAGVDKLRLQIPDCEIELLGR